MTCQTNTTPTTSSGSLYRNIDPQLPSRFFSLPSEIRNLIYTEFFRLSSTHQHIDSYEIPPDPDRLEASPDAEPTLVWNHVPCITDPGEEDVRSAMFFAAEPRTLHHSLWKNRLKSSWCLHWACQEQDAEWVVRRVKGLLLEGKPKPKVEREGRGRRRGGGEMACRLENMVTDLMRDLDSVSGKKTPRSRFIDLLTTCKRMYHEALPTLYSTLTFVLTDTPTAERFLSLYAPHPDRFPIRSLELCIRATNILTELYYPPLIPGSDDGPPPIFAGRARANLSMRDNPWQRVCDLLVSLPNLQALRIWFDTQDLRPWHKRVRETRFFGRLFDVKVAEKSKFVLGLPELPARRGPDHELLGGYFLEGEKLESAPFVVERGSRPNNWDIHLVGGRENV